MTSLIEDMCLFIFLALGTFQLKLENNLSSTYKKTNGLGNYEEKRNCYRILIDLIVCYCYDINEPIVLIRKNKNKKLTHCVNATKI
jgi:hypothetical protein